MENNKDYYFSNQFFGVSKEQCMDFAMRICKEHDIDWIGHWADDGSEYFVTFQEKYKPKFDISWMEEKQ